jgi:hypothetical protein
MAVGGNIEGGRNYPNRFLPITRTKLPDDVRRAEGAIENNPVLVWKNSKVISSNFVDAKRVEVALGPE